MLTEKELEHMENNLNERIERASAHYQDILSSRPSLKYNGSFQSSIAKTSEARVSISGRTVVNMEDFKRRLSATSIVNEADYISEESSVNSRKRTVSDLSKGKS